jgi:hypothetical protein
MENNTLLEKEDDKVAAYIDQSLVDIVAILALGLIHN